MFLFLLVFQTCYLPPVEAPIAKPFVAPACVYCPGHRGVEYDLLPGTAVRAAGSGIVTFAGVVAGTRYVVVLDRDGISATYGFIRSSTARPGDQVQVGQVIAVSGNLLYFGLRDGDGTPLDPTHRLAVASRRARLVPVDGSPRRAPAVTKPSCTSVAGTATSPR